jgi:hypothetical protein
VHALVEKPVGVYTRQARELIDIVATKPELTFGVFFNQRTNQLYQHLKALLGSGELGAYGTPPDHHHVVAAAGLIRPVRLAGHLGRRGRRGPGILSTCKTTSWGPTGWRSSATAARSSSTVPAGDRQPADQARAGDQRLDGPRRRTAAVHRPARPGRVRRHRHRVVLTASGEPSTPRGSTAYGWPRPSTCPAGWGRRSRLPTSTRTVTSPS